MNLVLFIVTSLAFGSVKAMAHDDICVATKPSRGITSERTRSIKTKDGRTITIIGQNHGDRLKLRSIKEVVNYKKDTNDLWIWTLQSILELNQKAVQHSAEETIFLSDFLKKNPDVKYVALEMLPETVNDHFKYSEKVRDDLLRESNRRKINNFPTTPYILGFAGSAVYLKLTEPGLMKSRIFFGAESKEEVEAHDRILSKCDSTLEALKEQINTSTLEGQNFLQHLIDIESEFIKLYPVYSPNSDKKIMETALAKTPNKYKKATSDWISTVLEEMKAMKKRDAKVADALLSKDGSSVMTIGLAHLESLTRFLEEKCKRLPSPEKKDPIKARPAKGVH